MIHFGNGVISYRGNKNKITRNITIIFLVLSFILVTNSCSGFLYHFQFSLEELETDLLSIEVVEFDFEGEEGATILESKFKYEVISIIEDEEEKNEILETLSKVEFTGIRGAPRGYSYYGLKLNYSDKHIVFTAYDICRLDGNHNAFDGCRDLLHFQEREYYTMLEK